MTEVAHLTGRVMTPAGPLSAFIDVVHYTTARPVLLPQQFGDGTNRSLDLKNWLYALPHGSTVDWGPARVRIDQEIPLGPEIDDLTINGINAYAVDLTGMGVSLATVNSWAKGDPRKNAARSRSQFRMAGCKRVHFVRGEVWGANIHGWDNASPDPQNIQANPEGAYQALLEAQHAFAVEYVTDCSWTDVKTYYTFGDGYCFSPNTVTWQWCEKIRVTGGGVYYSGRQGMSSTGSRDVKITRLEHHHNRRSMFDFEPNNENGGSEDWTLSEIYGSSWQRVGQRLNWLSGSSAGHVSNLLVEGSTALALTMNINTMERSSEVSILDNIGMMGIGNSGGDAWLMAGIDGLHVRRNYQPLQPGRTPIPMCLVHAYMCTGIDVVENRYPSNYSSGPWVNGDPGCVELRVS